MTSEAGEAVAEVELRGGPACLPTRTTITASELACGRLKIPSRGGYEHFELDHAAVRRDGAVAVFRWCDRTEVAE